MLRSPPGCRTQDCLGMGKLLPSHWIPLKQAFHLKISFSEDFFFQKEFFCDRILHWERVRDACFRKSADLISCLSCTYICDICCYQPKLQRTKNIFNILSFFLFLAMQSARFGSELEPGIGSRWASLAGRIFPTRGGLGCGGYGGVRCQWICQLDEHGTFQLLNPSSSDEWFPSEFPPKFAL